MKNFIKTISWLLMMSMHVVLKAQSLPTDIPGLELWLNADSGITITNDLVSQWNDQSGNNRHAYSDFNSTRPALIENALNDHAVVSFDGNIDFMYFEEITTIRTVFWIIRENPLADGALRRPLLGHPGGLYYTRSLQETFWDPALTLPEVVNGTTRLNMEIIDGTTTVVPNDYALISLVTTGNTPASHITMEADAFGRTWWGELAELIIYSEPLNEFQIEEVENYLASKYGPAYSALPDLIIEDSVCPVEICAPEGFSTYTWSDGSTTPCTTIHEEGWLYLTLTDDFGRTIQDSLFVDYPGNAPANAAIICLGDSLAIEGFQDESIFTTTLNDSPFLNTVFVDEEGFYAFAITDSEGCSMQYNFELNVDSLSAQIELAETFMICSGNAISPEILSSTELNFSWSTAETTQAIVPLQSDMYSLSISNENGCTFLDSTEVTITGTAADIAIASNPLCIGSTGIFEAVNLSGSNIATWNWLYNENIINGTTLTIPELPDFLSEIALEAITQENCITTITLSPSVLELPVINYTTQSICENQPVDLSADFSSNNGSIETVDWSAAFGTNGDAIWELTGLTAGSYTLTIQATDIAGCSVSTVFNQEVFASPHIAFTSTSNCADELTEFLLSVTNMTTDNLVGIAWDFGDNTTSGMLNPQHFYSNAGAYPVVLTAVSDQFCTGTFDSLLTIHASPEIIYINPSICLNDIASLSSASYVTSGDDITSWQWIDENGAIYINEFPVPTSNPDTLMMNVEAETLYGCATELQHNVIIRPLPQAAFSYSPSIAAAPVYVQFTNESIGGTAATWYLDGSVFSTEESPNYLFAENGTYAIGLHSNNVWGCSDSTNATLQIAIPVIDISLIDVTPIPGDQGYRIYARAVNTGNVPIHNPIFEISTGENWLFAEQSEVILQPGGILDFEFASELLLSAGNLPVVCVKAVTTEDFYTETYLEDNTLCVAAHSKPELLSAYPNPCPDAMHIRFIDNATEEVDIRIYDSMGNLALRFDHLVALPGLNAWTLSLQELRDGTYYMDVSTESYHAGQFIIHLNP